MTHSELIKWCEGRGAAAFNEKRSAAPAADGEFCATALKGCRPGSAIPFLEAWNRGWYRAMLAAPLEG